jgi:hypothetical protein
MFNPMAVRAKDDRVGESMQSARGLVFAMVNIAAGLSPTAPLALVAVMADRSFRPSVASAIATLTGIDGVAFAVVPYSVSLPAGRLGFLTETTAGLRSSFAKVV